MAGKDGGEHENDEGEAPTHLPFAPLTELSGASTTVDPGYIISLIRKLLPHNAERAFSTGNESESNHQELSTENITCTTWSDEMISRIEKLGRDGNSHGVLIEEDNWEECGCIIWDLSANRDHAEFMVDKFLLDVLSMSLLVSKSSRITEICLGILGNLACHDVLGNAIISTSGLVSTVVDKLTVNDSACLCELCRSFVMHIPCHTCMSSPTHSPNNPLLLFMLTKGQNILNWAEALSPEYVLQRVLWIADNTLNLQLLEKVLELLLAIISHEQVAGFLLPSLVKLGLPDLLISLFSSEMSKQRDEPKPERCSVLDLILQSIEALSTVDPFSQLISSDKRLVNLLSDIVKHPDRDEVGILYGSSVVIIANILMDRSDLAEEIIHDISFFENLLEILPFVAGDAPSSGALWSILSELLFEVQKNAVSPSSLQPYLSVLCDKAHFIGDQLEDLALDYHSQDLISTKLALSRISTLVDLWKTGHISTERSKSAIDEVKIKMLLALCCKYASA